MTSPRRPVDTDLLPDAVIRIDADRRVSEVNAATERLTRLGRDDLVGEPLADRLHPRSRDGRALLADGWHRSAALRSVSRIPEQDVVIRRGDGTDVRVFVTGRYERNGDRELSGAVLMLRDAGRRANVQATGIEVVSTVSHELRSPLTSVKGYTSLLLNRWDRLDDDKKKMMLDQVHHDADRVTRLVTELLDISRLETGRLVLRREMVDVGELAARVVEKVGMAYPELECAVAVAPDLPEVYADPDKIEQVLTNLVENAAKYASPKGMRVVSEVDGAAVQVSVIDQGEGIPEHDLHRVFTKFFRRSEGRPTGSGLGLWISRGLVESHGGRLTASSIEGEGTTFRFTLPLNAFDAAHGTRDGDGAPSAH